MIQMVDDARSAGYGQTDTRSTDQGMPEERILKIVEELARRWKMHRERNDFQAGMRAAWVQSISLLLGTPVREVVAALEGGRL